MSEGESPLPLIFVCISVRPGAREAGPRPQVASRAGLLTLVFRPAVPVGPTRYP